MKLVIAAMLGAALLPAEITVPLDGGKILIEDEQFIRVEFGSAVPYLTFKITNETVPIPLTLTLQFDMEGVCNGETRKWSDTVIVNFNRKGTQEFKDLMIPLVGKVEGCRTQNIVARLVASESAEVILKRLSEARLVAEREVDKKRREAEAEAAQIRSACDRMYASTADKKVGDLTVKEAQLVKACQDLGLYSK